MEIMEAKELRIGNIVSDDENNVVRIEKICSGIIHEFAKVSRFSERRNRLIYASNIFPIALTKDVLSDFGFIKREGNNICWDLGDFMIGWYGNSFATWVVELKQGNNKAHIHTQIKSVHQLQNLYFALMDEDLEINI